MLISYSTFFVPDEVENISLEPSLHSLQIPNLSLRGKHNNKDKECFSCKHLEPDKRAKEWYLGTVMVLVSNGFLNQ